MGDVVLNAGVESAPRPERRAPAPCPACGEDLASRPMIYLTLLGGVRVRRCPQCGEVSTPGPPARILSSCERCSRPIASETRLSHDRQVCRECAEGAETADHDPEWVTATERHLRECLEGGWEIVQHPQASRYLQRLVEDLSRRLGMPAEGAAVAVVRDPRCRVLSLPSGTILLSTGLLQALGDEAQLAFVLAHELALLATGVVRERLPRLVLETASREREPKGSESWLWAVEDVLAWGYGRKPEHRADELAMGAVLDLGYDPDSVFRWLASMEARAARRDEQVAEWATAHPPSVLRRHKLQRLAVRRTAGGHPGRTNREVFRRILAPVLKRDQWEVGSLPPLSTAAAATSRRWPSVLALLAALGLLGLAAWLGYHLLP